MQSVAEETEASITLPGWANPGVAVDTAPGDARGRVNMRFDSSFTNKTQQSHKRTR
jgi:hypothetical protein